MPYAPVNPTATYTLTCPDCNRGTSNVTHLIEQVQRLGPAGWKNTVGWGCDVCGVCRPEATPTPDSGPEPS
jgi:biotin synthase-related radical SAM superfamily protein